VFIQWLWTNLTKQMLQEVVRNILNFFLLSEALIYQQKIPRFKKYLGFAWCHCYAKVLWLRVKKTWVLLKTQVFYLGELGLGPWMWNEWKYHRFKIVLAICVFIFTLRLSKKVKIFLMTSLGICFDTLAYNHLIKTL